MPPKTPKSKTPARKKDKEAEKQQSVVEEFQNVEISTKDPRTVVLMLDSPEAIIICKACEALKKYVEICEPNCIEVLELGSLSRLVKLLSSVEKVIRSYAVLCLAAMVTNGAVRRALHKLDSVPPLLALLAPDEELIAQERASFSLSQLAVEYSYKVQLEKHSAHSPLLKLLPSPDADVQRNCVQTLCLMVEHYQSRPGVLEADPGLPSILELLQSEYAIIQELALKTLHSCMHNADCRQAVVNGDGLSKLVSFLGTKDCSDLHVLGVSVLSLCLEDAQSMVALQSSGCLQQLLTHITESVSPDMKRHAAKALAKAATNAVNQKILHEQEAEKTFLELLSSDDSGVIVSGCGGLMAMSSLHSSRQLIGCEGGLTKLLQSAQSEVGEVRAAAARTIATLISGAPANQKLLAEADGSEVLVQLLTDSMAECRQFAADCITNMAPDESYRCQFESAGAVNNLVDCLDFADSSVQASSVEALGMLCCDASARQQLSSGSGVSSLLRLLRSSHQDVVYKATWSLSVCARSSAIADAICKAGGLELVEKLSQSSGHAQSAVAKSALVRLLDSNLSAKYWVTGCLEPSDVIKDIEFFDAGLAHSSSRPFTPLSELMSRPLMGNQPVIAVNLLAKPPPPLPLSSGTTDEGNGLDVSQSTGNVPSRSKSRQQGKRKSRPEKESSEVISQGQGGDDHITDKASLPGLLEVDSGLWTHITHTQTNILPLPVPNQQVQEIAKYASEQLGGAVERSGPLGYELPAGYSQLQQKSNLVPLGELKAGAFQQRALLFKVLCDQVGVACSLERGEYGCHWNKVWLAPPQAPLIHPSEQSSEEVSSGQWQSAQSTDPSPNATVYVVDLMFEPGSLLPAHAPSAHSYQHLS